MDIFEFLRKLNGHTKEIYLNEINEVVDKGGTLNWLLGLSGGVLIFSYDKIKVNGYNYWLILIQSIIFLLIVITIYYQRKLSTQHREITISIVRMFEYLNFELELVPNEIQQDIEDGKKFNSIITDYVNGEYFQEDEVKTFNKLELLQKKKLNRINRLNKIAVFLMLVEFVCFFIGVYKLNYD